METRSVKRRKLLEQQCDKNSMIAAEIDRISNLPDSILQDILSLLPTKSVAQTSVLSKRFRYIWQSFPDLEFTTLDSYSKPTLTGFSKYPAGQTKRLRSSHGTKQPELITNILSLREKNSDLRNLRIRAHLTFTSLNALVRLALRLNVQELDMEVATNDCFNLPRSVSWSGSLRVFKFKSLMTGFRLPPTSVMSCGFKSLHTLSLSNVIHNEQPILTDLFTDSAFPSLRRLSLNTCMMLKSLKIACRGIEELSLERCSKLVTLEITVARLEVLKIARCFDAYCKVRAVSIVAPRLRVMELDYNALAHTYRVESEGLLEQASVGFFLCHTDNKLSSQEICGVSTLFSGLSCARSLILQSKCIQVLSVNSDISLPDPFLNLKTLELQIGVNKNNETGLIRLFKSSPSIHTLIIKILYDDKDDRRLWIGEDLWDTSTSCYCWEPKTQLLQPFLRNLKVVKIHGFSECQSEISLVRFLLRHSEALEEMTLYSGSYSARDSQRREKIKSKMMWCPRASSNAKLDFTLDQSINKEFWKI